jgi:protein-S-isoprenylcysteine O-methyltransferase Ste14
VRAFAWSGALLFVAALGYFLFSYSLRFSVVTPGSPDVTAILIDAALFSAFALHHSIFARERVRAAVARLVPAGLERSFYVWVASLLLIGVCAAWQPVGGVLWDTAGSAFWGAGGAVRWALVALQLVGVWLTIRSAAVIDVFDLAGLRTPAAPGVQASEIEFKTTGPYGWVRHPIYSGWFLLVFGVGTMTMTRLVFAVVSSVYVLVAIPFEERSLHHITAGAYDRYTRQVKWKLVPGIY